MFFEQCNEYTIAADEKNWVLVWHPKGPKYHTDKNGNTDRLPRGDKSYYSRLTHLSSAVLDKKARLCADFKDLSRRLPEIQNECERICRLEEIRDGK